MTKKLIAVTVLGLAIMGVTALGANAQTTSSSVRPVPPAQGKQLDIACMRTAVEKRENAIEAAWDKFAASIKSSLGTRKSELLTAWGITNRLERAKAINAAWAKFRTSRIAARKTLDGDRQAAWRQFIADRKVCGSGPTGEDPATDMAL